MSEIQETKNKKERDREMVYQLDGRPGLATAVPLGLQHVLAMFISGLTTFIQLYPLRLGKNYQVGAKLPIVMGTSFTFVPTASAIGAAGGIGAVLGGCMAGSLVEVFMGFFYKYIRRFFPPWS